MRKRLAVNALLLFIWACGGKQEPPLPKRLVDLSPVLSTDLPLRHLGARAVEFLGVPPRLESTPIEPAREGYAYGLALLTLPSQIGAHLDAPGRLLKNGARADEVALNRLVGPGKVFDLRWKGHDSPIQVSDLEHGSVEEGDMIILYVGYTPPREHEWPRFPPLSRQAAKWLAAKRVNAVLTDAPNLGSFPRYKEMMAQGKPVEEIWAEKIELFRSGIPVFEGIVNTAELVGEKRILIVALPLPIAERAGAPARVVAFIY